jgi:diaminopimelate epimerase
MGNPHAILKVSDIENVDVAHLGKALSEHSQFPHGANINFMQIIDHKNIKLRTYERGSGETLACGSGACAAVVIGRLWDLLDKTVTVYLHGGNLVVNCTDIVSPISMMGPAVVVFTGEYQGGEP